MSNALPNHIHPKSQKELRDWLELTSKKTSEPLWIVIFKKSSGQQGLTYEDVLKGAICFGLIDTQTKTISNESYGICLRARKTGSSWTKANIRIAQDMINQAQMTKSGLEAYKKRLK